MLLYHIFCPRGDDSSPEDLSWGNGETGEPSPAARLAGARAYSTIRSRRNVTKNEIAMSSAPTRYAPPMSAKPTSKPRTP